MKKALLLIPVVIFAVSGCDLGSQTTGDPKYQDKAVDQTKLSESGTPPPGIKTGTPPPVHK
jgi:hypothetical protein